MENCEKSCRHEADIAALKSPQSRDEYRWKHVVLKHYFKTPFPCGNTNLRGETMSSSIIKSPNSKREIQLKWQGNWIRTHLLCIWHEQMRVTKQIWNSLIAQLTNGPKRTEECKAHKQSDFHVFFSVWTSKHSSNLLKLHHTSMCTEVWSGIDWHEGEAYGLVGEGWGVEKISHTTLCDYILKFAF